MGGTVREVNVDFRGRDRLARHTKRNRKEMGKLDKEFRDVDRSAKKANRTLETTEKRLKRAGRASRGLGGGGRRVGRLGGVGLAGGFSAGGLAATGGIAATALFAGKALSESAKLELGIAKVMSLVRDPADQRAYAAKIEAIIRENVRLGRSVEEVSEALFKQISQQGLSEQSFENMNSGMRLAIGGFADSQASISAVNKLLANFPELMGDASKAANLLFTGQVFGDTDIQELASRLPQVAGLAASQGLSAAETISLVSVLTRKLGSTGQAVTATRGLILSLAQSTPEARKQLEALGVPATLTEFKELGLEESLRRLSQAAQENPDVMRRAIPEVEALAAAMALDETAISDMSMIQQAMNEDIANGTGLMDSYNRVMGTSAVTMARAAEAANELTGAFGDQLAPGVNRQLDQFSRLSNDIVDLGFMGAIQKSFDEAAIRNRQRLIAEGAMRPEDFRVGTDLGNGRVVVEVVAADGTRAKVVQTRSDGLDVGTQERGQ